MAGALEADKRLKDKAGWGGEDKNRGSDNTGEMVRDPQRCCTFASTLLPLYAFMLVENILVLNRPG